MTPGSPDAGARAEPTEQDRGVAAEGGYRPFLLRARQAAVIDRGRDADRGQVAGHLIEGLPERSEDKDLLSVLRVPLQLVEQHRDLSGGGKRPRTAGQVIPADLGQRRRGGGRT